MNNCNENNHINDMNKKMNKTFYESNINFKNDNNE